MAWLRLIVAAAFARPALGVASLAAYFGESREPLRLVAIGLVVAGVVGLKLAEP